MASSLTLRCAALLFDMDGVLVDSTRAVTRVWSQWARERGFDPHYVSHVAHGRPSITTIRELLPHSDAEAENREMERREIADLDGVVACPGAPELLASLPPERWALVTSSTRALAEVRLRAAGFQQPRFYITSSDIVNGKPHPEPYLKAAKMIGVDAAQCIVVEDAPAGIKAGKAAGCKVVALRTTMSEDVLVAEKPDWIVDNCTRIRAAQADGGLEVTLADAQPQG